MADDTRPAKHGIAPTADRVCTRLLESFDRGLFEGCLNGAEMHAWDGEVTLTHIYPVLPAIAQHKGWIDRLEPEWWPPLKSDVFHDAPWLG